jgi:hypothetical protein
MCPRPTADVVHSDLLDAAAPRYVSNCASAAGTTCTPSLALYIAHGHRQACVTRICPRARCFAARSHQMPGCCQGGAWIKPHAIAQGGGCAAAQFRPSSVPFSPKLGDLLKRAAAHCSCVQLWHGAGRQSRPWNIHGNLACLQGSVLQHATSHALPVRCPPFQSAASCHRHLTAAAAHLHHRLAGLGLEAASHPHTQHTAGMARHPAVEHRQQLSSTVLKYARYQQHCAVQRGNSGAGAHPAHLAIADVAPCLADIEGGAGSSRLQAHCLPLENVLAPRLLKVDGTRR